MTQQDSDSPPTNGNDKSVGVLVRTLNLTRCCETRRIDTHPIAGDHDHLPGKCVEVSHGVFELQPVDTPIVACPCPHTAITPIADVFVARLSPGVTGQRLTDITLRQAELRRAGLWWAALRGRPTP